MFIIYEFLTIIALKTFYRITKESIVDVKAKVSVVDNGVAGCTQRDVELVAAEIWVVSVSAPQLPLQIEDASRPEKADVIFFIFLR